MLATYHLGVAGAVEVGVAQVFLADDGNRAGVAKLAAPGGDGVFADAAPDRESGEPLDQRGNSAAGATATPPAVTDSVE